MTSMIVRSLALAGLIGLWACDAGERPSSAAPTPSAATAKAVQTAGVFCAVEQPASCYDLDVAKGEVTLMMGDRRGRAYRLEKLDDSTYEFALAPNQRMRIQIRDDSTIEAASANDTQSFIVLKRKR